MPQKKQIWVTTVDNPYDPFTQWDLWYRYDEKCGYHTCGTLARLANVSNDLSDAEYEDCVDDAIGRLLEWYKDYNVYEIAVEGDTRQLGLTRERNTEV